MNSFGFSCVFCTSEDPSHPFESLFHEGVQSSWISQPNPQFPIESVLDLKAPFVLTGLDIVSHESMICSRVDLFGTVDETLNSKTQWFSIGYFKFSNNQRSQWVARELKHVSTESVTVRYLRILVEGVHTTPPNRDMRVSLISLSLNGHAVVHPRMTCVDDLVEDITAAKLLAIDEENFGDAAIYKDQLLNIGESREELENLFKQKAELIQQEEYLQVDETVQKINAIINRVRPDENEQPIPSTRSEEPPKEEPLPQPQEPVEEVPSARVERPHIDEDVGPVIVGSDEGFFLTGFEKDTVIHVAPEDDVLPSPKPQEEEKFEEPAPLPPPKKKIPSKKPKVVKPVQKEKKLVLPPKERVPKFSKEPPEISKPEEPDQLSDENKAEAETLVTLFGERVVSIAYSSNWSLRVNGLEQLCELVKGLKTKQEKTKALNGMMPLLRRRFLDGLKATYVSAVEHTIDLLDSLEVEGNQLSSVVHVLLPIALNKIGDTNQRINEVSNTFAIWCTAKDKWSYQEVHSFAVNPPPNNHYHMQIAKMNLVSVLIEKYGIGEKGKFKLNDVMNLVVPCLDSRKEEVRKLAIKLTVSLQERFGSSIEKYLKNVPRLVKDQLSSYNVKK